MTCKYLNVFADCPLQIHEKRPQKVKNFGIWIRYDSRSGTHNMYKEYREMSRTDAVQALYQDLAARHRARFRSIQVSSSLTCCIRAKLMAICRFSRSLKSRRLPTFADHISNRYCRRISASLCHTVFPRLSRRRSSLPTGHQPSTSLLVLGSAYIMMRVHGIVTVV